MDKEKQLEQVANRALRVQQMKIAPPIFELYAALVAISVACMFFLLPTVLSGKNGFDAMVLAILPQWGWAIVFFVGGVTSATGILINSDAIRIIALILLSMIYGTFTVLYGFAFPNFGIILIGWLTIFTIASIPIVRFTGLRTKKEKGNENDAENDGFN